MDNRETSTPSSDDPILKRHLFSGVTIKGRGDVGRVYFVRRPSRQSFGFRVAASSGPILKAPGSAGGYLQYPWRRRLLQSRFLLVPPVRSRKAAAAQARAEPPAGLRPAAAARWARQAPVRREQGPLASAAGHPVRPMPAGSITPATIQGARAIRPRWLRRHRRAPTAPAPPIHRDRLP